jgi:hypothetical protein
MKTMDGQEERLVITIKEVAKALRQSESATYEQAARGDLAWLSPKKIGRKNIRFMDGHKLYSNPSTQKESNSDGTIMVPTSLMVTLGALLETIDMLLNKTK